MKLCPVPNILSTDCLRVIAKNEIVILMLNSTSFLHLSNEPETCSWQVQHCFGGVQNMVFFICVTNLRPGLQICINISSKYAIQEPTHVFVSSTYQNIMLFVTWVVIISILKRDLSTTCVDLFFYRLENIVLVNWVILIKKNGKGTYTQLMCIFFLRQSVDKIYWNYRSFS